MADRARPSPAGYATVDRAEQLTAPTPLLGRLPGNEPLTGNAKVGFCLPATAAPLGASRLFASRLLAMFALAVPVSGRHHGNAVK